MRVECGSLQERNMAPLFNVTPVRCAQRARGTNDKSLSADVALETIDQIDDVLDRFTAGGPGLERQGSSRWGCRKFVRRAWPAINIACLLTTLTISIVFAVEEGRKRLACERSFPSCGAFGRVSIDECSAVVESARRFDWTVEQACDLIVTRHVLGMALWRWMLFVGLAWPLYLTARLAVHCVGVVTRAADSSRAGIFWLFGVHVHMARFVQAVFLLLCWLTVTRTTLRRVDLVDDNGKPGHTVSWVVAFDDVHYYVWRTLLVYALATACSAFAAVAGKAISLRFHGTKHFKWIERALVHEQLVRSLTRATIDSRRVTVDVEGTDVVLEDDDCSHWAALQYVTQLTDNSAFCGVPTFKDPETTATLCARARKAQGRLAMHLADRHVQAFGNVRAFVVDEACAPDEDEAAARSPFAEISWRRGTFSDTSESSERRGIAALADRFVSAAASQESGAHRRVWKETAPRGTGSWASRGTVSRRDKPFEIEGGANGARSVDGYRSDPTSRQASWTRMQEAVQRAKMEARHSMRAEESGTRPFGAGLVDSVKERYAELLARGMRFLGNDSAAGGVSVLLDAIDYITNDHGIAMAKLDADTEEATKFVSIRRRNAAQVAYFLFWSLRSPNAYGLALAREDVEAAADRLGVEEAQSAWNMLDQNGDDRLTLGEVIDSVTQVFERRANLVSALADSESVVRQIRKAILIAMLASLAVLAVGIYDPGALTKVLTGASALIISLSFVFGNGMRQLFENVVFLFVRHPFDIGDLVRIDDKKYVVDNIHLYYLEATDVHQGVGVNIPLHRLLDADVINKSRSKTLWDCVEFTVDMSCDISACQVVADYVVAIIATKSRVFGGMYRVTLDTSRSEQKVVLAVNYDHKSGNVDAMLKSEARTLMVHSVSRGMVAAGIVYTNPPTGTTAPRPARRPSLNVSSPNASVSDAM